AIDRETHGATRSITVQATSSDGSTATQSFNIAINDLDEFDVSTPVDLVANTNEVQEGATNGSPVGIRAFAIDQDSTNNSVTFSLDDDANGRFTIDSATGMVTVADGTLLDFETATSHNIIVRATSIDGSTATTTMSIAVIDVNEAPVAFADTALAIEAGGVANNAIGFQPVGNVLANDTDIDAGDTKTVIGVSAGVQASAAGGVASNVHGSFGSIIIHPDGSYTYNVDNDNPFVEALASSADTLQDVFTYTMRDSGGLTSTTQISITIAGANDSPLITVNTGDSQTAEIAETDSGLVTQGTLSVTDVDLSNTVAAEVTHVVASGTTTGLVSNTAALRSMLAVNSNVIAADSTTGTLHWSFNSDTDSFDYLASGESLMLIYTITVVDSAGASDSEEVTITIEGTNDAPVAIAGSVDGNEDESTITGQLIASDVDASDTLTFSLVSGPNEGSVSVASDGVFTFLPGSDFQDLAVGESRTVSFVYRAADAQGVSDQQTLSITISGRNDTPLITIVGSDRDTANLLENGGTLTATGTMTVADIDRSNVVTATVTGVSIGGTVAGLPSTTAEVLAMFSVTQNVVGSSSQSGSLSWLFDSNNVFFDYLLTDQQLNLIYEVTVQDSDGSTAVRYVNINISTNNQAPIAASESYTILPNGRLTLTAPGPLVNDYDPDGDAIQFVLVSGPTWGTLTFTPDGSLVYQPAAQYAALDVIRYRVTDGRLYSQIVELQITTLALPIQETLAPPASPVAPGPLPDANPSNQDQPVEALLGDPAVALHADVATSSTAATTEPMMESTIVAMQYTAKENNLRSLESDQRSLQSIGWVFTNDFNQPRFGDRGFIDRASLIRSELIAAMMSLNDISKSSLSDFKLEAAIVTTANATLSAATAGTIFWAMRGAALIATVASSFPALRNLDPANLLAEYRASKRSDDEDDELESLVKPTTPHRS
ncbi:MAG TPA: hypothetical protein DDZ51_21815, partial [Planctomycetaceae bacterium]|nr:hypothetical protein [Planctomycetaceae bacterium]